MRCFVALWLRNLPRGAAQLATEALAEPVGWRTGVPVLLQSEATADGVRYVAVRAEGQDQRTSGP